jgi:hypothetical protein
LTALETPVPTTELAAVNAMLLAITEAPVNTLTGLVTTDVATAKRLLSEETVAVQSKGWTFNTEFDYPLSPDISGEVTIPKNTARVDVDSRHDIDVVQRGSRLYDRKNHTYTFSDKLSCTIVLLLPFEELPQSARYYVTIRAVRKFQSKVIGSETSDGYNAEDERDAKLTLEETEADNGDHNIFNNYHSASILDRTSGGY